MTKSNLSIILSVLAICLTITSLVLHFKQTKKIGYVRSKELFDGYLGMKEASTKYKEKVEKWQANLDTLGRELEKGKEDFEINSKKWSKGEKELKYKYLQQKEQNLEEYRMATEQKAAEEDKQITVGVLNQVNSFVKQFAEKNGYEIILGTTASGNILYGNEAIDVTETLLKELNEEYKGK